MGGSMNRTKLIVYFLLSLVLMGSALSAERVFFLGHPRSGNHWMTYILVQLLDRPCVSHPSVEPFFWMSEDKKKAEYLDDPLSRPVILHAHNPFDAGMHLVDFRDDWLIFILRDFKETLMSDNHDHEANVILRLEHERRFLNMQDPYRHRVNSYVNDLRCYDQWNPEKRLIVYYEDLIASPNEVLTQLASVFGLSQERLDSFLENFEVHQSKCFNRSFIKKRKLLENQGVFDLKRHTKKMSPRGVRIVDEFFKRQCPDYWDRYLYRYEGV